METVQGTKRALAQDAEEVIVKKKVRLNAKQDFDTPKRKRVRKAKRISTLGKLSKKARPIKKAFEIKIVVGKLSKSAERFNRQKNEKFSKTVKPVSEEEVQALLALRATLYGPMDMIVPGEHMVLGDSDYGPMNALVPSGCARRARREE